MRLQARRRHLRVAGTTGAWKSAPRRASGPIPAPDPLHRAGRKALAFRQHPVHATLRVFNLGVTVGTGKHSVPTFLDPRPDPWILVTKRPTLAPSMP